MNSSRYWVLYHYKNHNNKLGATVFSDWDAAIKHIQNFHLSTNTDLNPISASIEDQETKQAYYILLF